MAAGIAATRTPRLSARPGVLSSRGRTLDTPNIRSAPRSLAYGLRAGLPCRRPTGPIAASPRMHRAQLTSRRSYEGCQPPSGLRERLSCWETRSHTAHRQEEPWPLTSSPTSRSLTPPDTKSTADASRQPLPSTEDATWHAAGRWRRLRETGSRGGSSSSSFPVSPRRDGGTTRRSTGSPGRSARAAPVAAPSWSRARSVAAGANVGLRHDGPIATVTLDRPEYRNSLSDHMLGELIEAFGALRDDARSRVVVVTGAPPVFSAGAHYPARRGMTDEERRTLFLSTPNQFRRLFERVTTLLENLEQATIAMINGHAIGGGWGLTLACDFRWAAADAMLGIPEVDLGVPLGVASTTRFVRLVGPALAKEIIMEGRRYTAAEAHAMGLVHRVLPEDQLPAAVREYAERLAAKPFAPLAQVKARINAIARTGIPEVNAMTEGFLPRE